MATTADEHKRYALELSAAQRWGMGIASVALAAVALASAWVLRHADSMPDLLLGVLAIGALVFGGLSVIGRLPVGFQLGGVALEFERADLADFINTLRSQLKDDADARDALLDKLRDAVGPTAFLEAERYAEDTGAGPQPAPAEVGGREPSGTRETPQLQSEAATEQSVSDLIGSFADPGTLVAEYNVPGSGRGKMPRFDYYLTRHGQGVVVELENYWNQTSLELVERKVNRALLKGTPVSKAIVLVPPEGLRAYASRFDGRSDVLVTPFDTHTASATRGAVADFLTAAG